MNKRRAFVAFVVFAVVLYVIGRVPAPEDEELRYGGSGGWRDGDDRKG